MIPVLTEAKHIGDYRVWLKFADGASGEVDIADALRALVFEPLKECTEFAKLRVDPELDTIVWPNGADLSPEYLYDKLAAAQAVATHTKAAQE